MELNIQISTKMAGSNIVKRALILSIVFLTTLSLAGSNKQVVQIHKFCSQGLVMRQPDLRCLEVVEGKNWTATLYDSETFQRLDPAQNEQVEREYPKLDWECDHGDEWLIFAKPLDADERPLFILLTNGKVMWRSERCTSRKCRDWVPLLASKYYIDGVGSSSNSSDGAYYSGHEYDQVVYVCKSDISEGERLANESLIRTSRIYVAVQILTFFFYLLTTSAYALLWSNQMLPGRTMLSVVLSRTLVSFFLCLAYIGQLDRWDLNAPKWWCVFIGVSAYFFHISAYAWVFLLNFDFWWTFRSLRPALNINVNEMKKKYILYSCFGWGLPFLITLFSVVIDSIYKSDFDADPLLVPNYGDGICFMVMSAQPMYIYLVQSLFLLPSVIFAVLTFYSLRKARSDPTPIRKHGNKNASSFQLYAKLFVIMSVSWAIHTLLWPFQPTQHESDHNFTTKTILAIQSFDAIGTAVIIFFIYVCKRSVLAQLEQKYSVFRSCANSLRNIRQRMPFISTNSTESSTATQ
ncbi:unnamed protein product [Orchesella dallaii]|uniref:G-protein coupled receptors family 2 profile 2 domain-containing protein n=1 Tax=Orchesella dallaii TaxID=48710 RepID=A0ABP1PLF6_9HEXA